MSLTLSPDLLDQARHGEVDDAAFTACIQASLPYAWQVISDLTERLYAAGADLADNHVPPSRMRAVPGRPSGALIQYPLSPLPRRGTTARSAQLC